MDEARAVWATAALLPYPWSPALQLLLLTACRENEICGAKWEWYHSKGRTLLIPHYHYKSNRDFLVTLSEPAGMLVDSLPRFHGDFMLSTTGGAKPIAGVPRKVLDRLHGQAEVALGRPMKRFTLHDLRRTVRTHLGRLGVSDVVAELVLGHALKGLQARYNVYGYEDEKRAALERWASELVGPPAHP
jgi:integrase